METDIERKRNCLLGAFLGDALAMPVHWYYGRAALRRDYGRVADLVAPKNPHADSILWRSSYAALDARGEILHDQAKYWGQRGVHYHQFLRAGENTLNAQLAFVLLESLRACGGYDRGDYTRRYIGFMTTPGSHRDTYVEECHRNFFSKYARGKNPGDCGGEDIHIGGLAHVPVLAVWYANDEKAALAAVHEHLRVTHRGELVETAARDLTKMLVAIFNGAGVRESIEKCGNGWVGRKKLGAWSARPDEEVVGAVLSPACYLQDAFPASLYLAWKYAEDLEAALVSNANLGGDNCHRGIVVGALVGAGGADIPDRWAQGLRCRDLLA
ncbi:MAG: ADP-ribosylglycohydrolase family protein [Chthoniobacterales bacterium]|nr:ADP-ribosylglycohydrolase family protein [Chthoniobacterales bacterium]